MSELLDRIVPTADDLIVSTGDIVRKGPQPERCLELWQARGYHAVIGNNEEKVLEDRSFVHRPDLIEFISRWPLVVDVPALNITVVHGGLYPGMPVEEEAISRAAADVVRLRWIRHENGQWRRAGKSKERDEDVLWSEVWDGPRTVVYGHTPLREPRVDRYAIGLDTGCVYGGWLTAAIHDGQWRFERVRARRKYAD